MIVDFSQRSRDEVDVDKYMYMIFKTVLEDIRYLTHVEPSKTMILNEFIHAWMHRDNAQKTLTTLQEMVYYTPIFVFRDESLNFGGSAHFDAIEVEVRDELGNKIVFTMPIILINFSVYKYIENWLRESMFIKEEEPATIYVVFNTYRDLMGHELLLYIKKLVDKGLKNLILDIYELYGIIHSVSSMVVHELGHATLFKMFGMEYAVDEMFPRFVEEVFRKLFYIGRFCNYLGKLATLNCIRWIREKYPFYEDICVDLTSEYSRKAVNFEYYHDEFEKLSDEYPQYSLEEILDKLIPALETGKIWIFGFPRFDLGNVDIISFDRAVFNWIRVIYSEKLNLDKIPALGRDNIKRLKYRIERKTRSITEFFEKIITLTQYDKLRTSFLEEKLTIKIKKIIKIEKTKEKTTHRTS